MTGSVDAKKGPEFARIIIMRGSDSLVRLPGTIMEVAFPVEQVELIQAEVRHAIDLAGRVWTAQRVSSIRSKVPAPGTNAAMVQGCKCQGPKPGYTMQQYRLDPDCIVHKGKWPSY